MKGTETHPIAKLAMDDPRWGVWRTKSGKSEIVVFAVLPGFVRASKVYGAVGANVVEVADADLAKNWRRLLPPEVGDESESRHLKHARAKASS